MSFSCGVYYNPHPKLEERAEGVLADTYGVLAALAVGLVPGVEPRYIVPLLAPHLGLGAAALAATLEAVLLSFILAILVDKLTLIAERISPKLGPIGRVYVSARRRAEARRALAEKYGVVGLAAFVAIPLPLTGIYTGALLAFLVGLSKWRTFLALAAGGAASVALVAAASMGVFRVVGLG
jgi:uncharacterized membrane protein